MKQVNIETNGAGCDWIYMSLLSTLKNKVGELKNVGVGDGQDALIDIIRIAETMHEVCEARENSKQA